MEIVGCIGLTFFRGAMPDDCVDPRRGVEEYLEHRVHEAGVSHIEESKGPLFIVPFPVQDDFVQRFDCFRWLRDLDRRI